ncbi:MAG: hypothetical protein JO173_12375 [Gammaproteobacteria bacterium]|nr:hypothetical protein [Gammaproteobacteria bacterium]
MISQLRLTLLVVGVLFIAALAWWERRRPRQAGGALERTQAREPPVETPARSVREPGLALPQMRARDPLPTEALPIVELPHDLPHAPVLKAAAGLAPGTGEPKTAEDGFTSAANGAAASNSEAGVNGAAAGPRTKAESPTPAETAERANGEPARTPAARPPLPRESLPELPPAPPLLVEWPPDRQRRVLALRLVAPLSERFAGRSLRQALAAEGFVLGQFAIFHKPDEERRAVLSAASLTRPGTFDMDTMDSQHYGGLSLFAVLPGPKTPPQAFEELVFTARNLNERLHGLLQDEQGSPLTAQRIALLREQLSAGISS